ncbi:MAG: radical SAM protein, partial [Candidatus Dojkabacteria bacterium]
MTAEVINVVDFGNDLFLLSKLNDCFLYSASNGIAMKVYEGGKQVLEDYFSSSGKDKNLEVEAILRANGFLEHQFIPQQKKEYLPTSVVFSVTSDCNLRCVYCYARAGLDSHRMSPELAKAAIDVVIQNARDKDEKKINIGFLGGGETMLEYDLVKFIVEYVKSHWDKEISFSMVTNATLLDKEKSGYLVSNNFNITVSLDGPKEVHDIQRPTISGRGSYDACIRGVKNLKSSGCKKIGI